MVTLTDLSAFLGLSKTQVSRALNGYPDVNEATRQRVIKAARELGYRPNALAQKLRRGRSGIVGLVLPERSAQHEANILNEMLLGLAIEFRRRDTLVVLNVMPEGGTTVEAYERLTNDGRLDGFIVLNPSADLPGIRYLQQAGMPVVVHGRHQTDVDYPYVDIDNFAAGRMMAEHLIALGHRDISLVEGPPGVFYADERQRGIEHALAAVGASLRPDRIVRGLMTERLGEMAAYQFHPDRSDHPSAVIAGNRVVARGLIRALTTAGLTVPGDVSVVAHDDDLVGYPASSFRPSLTGTHSPFAAAYDLLAEHLNKAIAKTDGKPAQAIIDPNFVEGESTAPPSPPSSDKDRTS